METCKICGKEVKSIGPHIYRAHNTSSEDYYLSYIGNNGVCKCCGKQTSFDSLSRGYRTYCSCSCATKGNAEKAQQTCLERYGTKYPFNSDKAKQKRETTNLEKYGSITPLGNKKIQENIIKNNKEKFGCDYPLQNKEILEKTKKSVLEHYGVNNPGEVQELQQKRIDTLNKKKIV